MAIETVCSGCGKQLAVDDSFAGRKAKCPVCGFVYIVPGYPAETNPFSGFEKPSPDKPLPQANQPSSDSAPIDSAPSGQAGSTASSYWVKTGDGNVYGPGDRPTLSRWFTEGRLTPDCTIREGQNGPWKSLSDFGFQTASANPYADTAYHPPNSLAGMPGGFVKSDRSGIILTLGILSWFVSCPILGLVAWIMGSGDVREMKSGRMDPRNMGLTQVGLYLGLVHAIVSVLCIGGYIAIIIMAVATGNFN